MEVSCLIDGKSVAMESVVAALKGFGKTVIGLPSWKYEIHVPIEIFVEVLRPAFKRFVELELADDEEIDDQDLLALRKIGYIDLQRALVVEGAMTRSVMKRFIGLEIVDAFTSADEDSLSRKAFVLQTLDDIDVLDDDVLLTGLAYPAHATST